MPRLKEEKKTEGLKFGWANDLSLKMADAKRERGLRDEDHWYVAATAVMPLFSAQKTPMRSEIIA